LAKLKPIKKSLTVFSAATWMNMAFATPEILQPAKKYASSGTFVKEYSSLKENNRPQQQKIQTPEEMRQSMIEQYRKNIAETETSFKKSDLSVKPVFEKVLTSAKEQLKEAENPNNKVISNYAKNYDALAKQSQQVYEQQLKNCELKYPANHLLFVKTRLQQFMDETGDIDYAAELTIKKGFKVFVNPVYEAKGKRWKMAYRAGKDAMETARALVQHWIKEIK
jgi:hypothetical protein